MKAITKIMTILTILIFTFHQPVSTQSYENLQNFKNAIEKGVKQSQSEFNHVPKETGHYTTKEWREVIDSTWGEGLLTETKLEIFETFWKSVDEGYPSFQNIEVNWDSLYTVYQPEVAAGVSRGRFYAIMCNMFLTLKDMHTRIWDMAITQDNLELGVPLLVPSGYWDCGHFGAGLSPLPDGSLLVYSVVPNHPLGLEIGDIVLGYDGIPWKDLYKEMLNAQLPIVADYTSNYWETNSWGNTDFSYNHLWLSSAGMNWHLFDTIDILKYDSGDTLHLSTSFLQNQDMEILCSAQMPVPGVPMPDVKNGELVSWGIIEGTQIGYIYVYSWWPETGYSPGDEFAKAVQSLMNEYDTKGLIIDSRINQGGNASETPKGLKMLFNEDQDIFDVYNRADPDDYYAMKDTFWGQFFSFKADEQLYNKPIAVLTGPASQSMGDIMCLQMKYHPMAKIFGLPTCGAFGPTSMQTLQYSDQWGQWLTIGNMRLKNEPGEYLTHVNIEVDEQVWLTQEDVILGVDTVVKKAVEWINGFNQTHIVELDDNIPNIFSLGQNYPNPFNPTTTITYNLDQPGMVSLVIYDLLGREVDTLVNEMKTPGNYGVTWNAEGFSSGVYFYRIESGGSKILTQKMMLVK